VQGGRTNEVVLAAPTESYKRRAKLILAALEVRGVHSTV
jgi:hypothetical protein